MYSLSSLRTKRPLLKEEVILLAEFIVPARVFCTSDDAPRIISPWLVWSENSLMPVPSEFKKLTGFPSKLLAPMNLRTFDKSFSV
jgi:hypothetical protein